MPENLKKQKHFNAEKNIYGFIVPIMNLDRDKPRVECYQ